MCVSTEWGWPLSLIDCPPRICWCKMSGFVDAKVQLCRLRRRWLPLVCRWNVVTHTSLISQNIRNSTLSDLTARVHGIELLTHDRREKSDVQMFVLDVQTYSNARKVALRSMGWDKPGDRHKESWSHPHFYHGWLQSGMFNTTPTRGRRIPTKDSNQRRADDEISSSIFRPVLDASAVLKGRCLGYR